MIFSLFNNHNNKRNSNKKVPSSLLVQPPSLMSSSTTPTTTIISSQSPPSSHQSTTTATSSSSSSSMTAATAAAAVLDVLIIGGGLSGLLIARGIHDVNKKVLLSRTRQQQQQQQHEEQHSNILSWKLLEARSNFGGRIANDDDDNNLIDMGGAWIWPKHQPKMRNLVQSLNNISTFIQPDDPSSTRIVGGAYKIIRELVKEITTSSTTRIDGNEDSESQQRRIVLNTPVTSCTLENNNNDNEGAVVVRVETAQHQVYRARKVVFAVPPKVLMKHVTFNPPLSETKLSAIQRCHTWMAGVTKVALVYPERFWDLEYSNMGFPQHLKGPAFQVYDSSTVDGDTTALTFFTHLPANNPASEPGTDNLLARQVAEQMARLWQLTGQSKAASMAGQYSHFHVKRWPMEQYISEDQTPNQINSHPTPIQALQESEWNDMLHFAGTETDSSSPGVMEGAVGAAERVLKSILQSVKVHDMSLIKKQQAEQCSK